MTFKDDEDIDAQLRAAFSEGLPDASRLQQAVRKQIAAGRSRRYMLWAAAALVLIAAALLATRGNSAYAGLARDHQQEVVEHQPRRWKSTPEELSALAARFGVTVQTLARITPAGYRLLHAKSCGMAGRPVLHLVYTDGTREVSLYVRQRQDAAFHPGSATVGVEQVAAVERNGFEVAAVLTGARNECLELAQTAASHL